MIEQASTLVQVGNFCAELAPSADSYAGRVPAQTGLFWRFAEPEVAVVEELEFVIFVEDGLVLAATLAIVAPDADVVVAVEGIFHVLELFPKHFLSPENVGRHKVHLVADDLTAFLPMFALHAVVPVLVTNVVGAD